VFDGPGSALEPHATGMNVNLVRTYLQVTTLSDIVSADGYFILRASWNGNRIPDHRSTTQFARQLQPTPYQRGLWRRLLRSFLVLGSKAPDLLLQTPLGAWTSASTLTWGTMMWLQTLYRRDPHVHSRDRDVALHNPQ
jgi:hypothetical protein